MGGKALGTNPINNEDIEPTLRYLSPIVGIPFTTECDKKGKIVRLGLEDLTLGSSSKTIEGMLGKNGTVGDIDIALDETKYDYNNFLARVVERLGPENIGKPMSGLKVIPTKVPVAGNPGRGYVQVDFMFGNPDLLKWTYSSPDPQSESKYNGAYRNILLNAIAQSQRRQVRDPDTQEVIALVGPSFMLNRGLVNQWRHFPLRHDGNGRTKSMRAISKENFSKIYPDHVGKEKLMELGSPQEIVDYMFPKSGLQDSDLDSYEKVRDAVICYLPDQSELIFNRFIANLQKAGFEVPSGLVLESAAKIEFAKVLKEVRSVSMGIVSEAIVRKNTFEEFRTKCKETLGGLKQGDYFSSPKINADLVPLEGMNYLINKCGLTNDWKALSDRDFGTDYHHRVAALEGFYGDLLELMGADIFFSISEHYGLKITPESFLASLIEMENNND